MNMNPVCGKSIYFAGLFIFVSVTLLLIASPSTHASGEYNKLLGFWQCQEEGQSATLEFNSKTQLLYNGKPANYHLAPGVIRVQEDYNLVDYYYTVEGKQLLIISPDGSVTQCQKTVKPPKQTQASRHVQSAHPAQPKHQNWPQYSKPTPPPGGYTGNESDLATLVWKFAGKWSHYTPHTETHMYLAPDGSYSDSYDSSYGGQFFDQGGYQTGNWVGAGSERGKGHWQITGTLKRGKIFVTKQDGSAKELSYQVHIKNGEIYWGEYFFNGELYSVEYVFR
jgi:hypothetical protein